jgi:SIR2-like domain
VFPDAHLTDLKAAVRDRRLIVVAGAGVSRGAGLPLWEELIRERMPKFLRGFGTEGARVADQVVAIAEFPLHAAGIWWDWIERNEGLDLIDRFFAETFPQDTPPTGTHEKIVRLCHLAGPCVVTTNFDLLFERCRGSTLVARTQFDSSFGWLLSPGRQGLKFLLKLHGTVGNIDTLVLTARQYGQQSEREAYGAFWNAVQLSHVLLFVGYGGRDPDLDQLRGQLVARFRGNVSPVYMLLDRPDPGLRASLKSARVVVAEFDGQRDGYGSIDGLLDNLLEAADAAVAVSAVPVAGGRTVDPRFSKGAPVQKAEPRSRPKPHGGRGKR